MTNAFLILFGFLTLLGGLYFVCGKAGLLIVDPKPDATHDKNSVDEIRYRVRSDALLTQNELGFVPKLDKAARLLLDELGPLRVLAKVNLADLLEPGNAFNQSQRVAQRNRIDRQHVNFILVDEHWKPVCAIELDDSSHRRSNAKKRDAKKDAALRIANLPLVRVTARDLVETVVQNVGDRVRSSSRTGEQGHTRQTS